LYGAPIYFVIIETSDEQGITPFQLNSVNRLFAPSAELQLEHPPTNVQRCCMSAFFACAIVIGLLVVLLAPAVWAVRSARGQALAAVVLLGLLASTTAVHVGLALSLRPKPGSLAAVADDLGTGVAPESLSAEQCGDILSAAESNRLIIDRSDPHRIIVSGKYWEQLPRQIGDILLSCHRLVMGVDSSSGVELIQS
jgi:hypothetical protein